jgi:hypothetical protein
MNTEQRAVQVVRMGTLTVYEITEDELRLVESGDPSSILLNFGIAGLSLGGGIGATLLTAGKVESLHVFVILVILTIVGVLGGLVLLVLWRRQAKRTQSIISVVRGRAQTQITTASITTSSTGGR